MKKMILRADDLGYSKAINLGISESVHNGLINNVGVMVNMPETENGLNLLKDTDVCLGLHTVICTGKPLSDPKLIPSITNFDGTFVHSKVYRSVNKDFVNLDEVVMEIEAQYQKFVQLVGRDPDYFEGHAVVSDNFIKGLKIVAKRHNLNFLDFALGPDSDSVPFKNIRLYSYMDSMNDNYDPYDTLRRAALAEHEDGYSMMVCHPGYLDNDILTHSSLTIPRTQEVAMLTNPQTRKWIDQNDISLIKYSDIK
ncbi:ChbG/HpnK family deacetylase [Companilactobacillus halodurans]|uniref:ChbG/HpnK family deacetylase n=1 Tax=Companilactobacillus halodurans TaxID=2584183 RepID=A0A5P0ZX31_9LACO|nr:ChbG/HpnK family deacetylase [Companilactobacillus halodurans]MQS75497.1 ChbG/HpnK family deacetylase [Companilactobacillus halodurans]MQS97455.1 ChbG/HpnK family deacetylase [Companilactobacillus halodurans]